LAIVGLLMGIVVVIVRFAAELRNGVTVAMMAYIGWLFCWVVGGRWRLAWRWLPKGKGQKCGISDTALLCNKLHTSWHNMSRTANSVIHQRESTQDLARNLRNRL